MAVTPYCFYTPEKLIYRLICLIGDVDVHTVIDINCGQGAMLKAAKSIYKNAELTGVDIIKHDFYKSLERCIFYHENGFDYVKRCKKTYDLVLSNPPFGISKANDFDLEPIKELNRKRLECQMFNANLTLMHENSKLIIILPATFVIGNSFVAVRRAICKMNYIQSIVSLPDDTFGSHHIKTYAIMLERSNHSDVTILYEAKRKGDDWVIERKTIIPYEDIAKGKWTQELNQPLTVKINIFRGNLSSNDFCNSGIPVYHSAGKKDGIWKPSIRYTKQGKKPERRTVIGDVIINRVGHSSGFWWVNTENDYLLSDCLFALRGLKNPESILEKISIDGRLDIIPRGVASPFITQNDILVKIGSVWKECDEDEVSSGKATNIPLKKTE